MGAEVNNIEKIIQSFGISYWIYTPKNELFESLLDGQKRTFEDWKKFVFEDDYIAFFSLHTKLKNGADNIAANIRLLRDGRYKWIHIQYTTERKDGKLVKAFCSARSADNDYYTKKLIQKEMMKSYSRPSKFLARAAVNLSTKKVFSLSSPFSHILKMHSEDETTSDCVFPAVIPFVLDTKQRADFKSVFSYSVLLSYFKAGNTSFQKEYWISAPQSSAVCIQVRCAIYCDMATGDIIASILAADYTAYQIREDVSTALLSANFEHIAYLDLATNKISIIGKDFSSNFPSVSRDDDYYKNMFDFVLKYAHPDDRKMCGDFFDIENLKDRLAIEKHLSLIFRFNENAFEDRPTKYRLMKISAFYLYEKGNIIVFARSNVSNSSGAKTVSEREHNAKIDGTEKLAFISRVHNAVNLPLNSIINFADFGLKEKEPSSQMKYFNKIKMAANYLQGVITDVLDMQKIQSGNFEFDIEEQQFQYVIETVESIIRPVAEEKNIHFECKIAPEANCAVKMDVKRLIQVCSNLLNNAVKYTQEGGSVSLSVQSGTVIEGSVPFTITVTDSGYGIPNEVLNHIFSSANDSFGLGFVISKAILELMGGTIDIQSQVGKGTMVIVNIRLEMSNSQSKNKVQNPHNDKLPILAGKRILIVEDDNINAGITVHLLEREGAITEVTHDGKAAVDMFASSSENYYDAILMDIFMGGMNGIEATKLIRSKKRGDALSIPIVASTSSTNRADMIDALDAGMNSYVRKPLSPEKLFMAIRSVLPWN